MTEYRDKHSDVTFEEMWDSYVAMDKEVSQKLGLPPMGPDDEKKEQARELWEEGRLGFIGHVPVIDTA